MVEGGRRVGRGTGRDVKERVEEDLGCHSVGGGVILLKGVNQNKEDLEREVITITDVKAI